MPTATAGVAMPALEIRREPDNTRLSDGTARQLAGACEAARGAKGEWPRLPVGCNIGREDEGDPHGLLRARLVIRSRSSSPVAPQPRAPAGISGRNAS